MACPLHISFPGTLYRVASRGNARQKIFRDDEGRKTFLEWVESDIAILTICGAGMCKNGAFSLFLLHAAVDRRTTRHESRLVFTLRSFRKQQLAFNPF